MYRGVFSLVCFLIYGVKSKSGHDWIQSFGPTLHASGPKIGFWRNFIMILHGFCWRSWKIKLFWPKTLIFDQKSKRYKKKIRKIPQNPRFPKVPCGALHLALSNSLLEFVTNDVAKKALHLGICLRTWSLCMAVPWGKCIRLSLKTGCKALQRHL